VQIGLVGLGRMGDPLARRLTKADHDVVGFDVSLDVLDQAGRAGRAESSTRDAIPARMTTDHSGAVLTVDELARYRGEPLCVFVGISTAGSGIHNVYPSWAPLFAPGSVLRGLDFPEHASPRQYRDVVTAMAANPDIGSAVITSHKLRLYQACHDMIDIGDPLARLTREINCLDVTGHLRGFARDPLSLQALLGAACDGPPIIGRPMVCIGAGGSATALLLAVGLDLDATLADGRPAPSSAGARPHLTIVGRTAESLDALDRVRRQSQIPASAVTFRHAPDARTTGDIVAAAPPGSVIINATGLGKTAPGSPLPGQARFPPSAIAWDFNYRGPLTFLRQARQAGITQMDGWPYFVAGWTAALSAVTATRFTARLLAEAGTAASPHAPSPPNRKAGISVLP
jgi:shikimate dehydrogenase